MDSLISKMETVMQNEVYPDKRMWFSMWFLGAIVTFGAAFFPMFYHLIERRNKHFRHEAELEKQVSDYLKRQGKNNQATNEDFTKMNAKGWAVSIIFVIPVFVIVYLLSRDLLVHERKQDAFLLSAFPERLFMPQTVPIKTYVLITACTLGVGVIYWLYKVVNLYNAHYKAQMQVEIEIGKLMEERKAVEHM